VSDATESIGDGTKKYAGWGPEASAPGTRRRKNKRGRRGSEHVATISITSLTDMVTVLLVYLLKTFATSPIEIKDPSLELPRSVCNPAPGSGAREREGGPPPRDGCGEIQETTLVMVTAPKKGRSPRIAVNSDAILEMDGATFRVPDQFKDPNSGGWVISPLRDALKKARELKEIAALRDGKEFDGKVVILADKDTPYRVLSEVLVTCGESGFADFRFAVIKPE
jgi:biopolymer transport protein ExbD